MSLKRYSILLQNIFVLILLIKTVKPDLPVHCLLKDVTGKWDFTISNDTFSPSLENEDQTSCGHGLPNEVVEISRKEKLVLPNSKKVILDLKENFDLYENGKKVGTWSMIYDQSLLI